MGGACCGAATLEAGSSLAVGTRVKLMKKTREPMTEPHVPSASEHRPELSVTMQSRMIPFHDSPVTERKRSITALGNVSKLACRLRKLPVWATVEKRFTPRTA